jgi:DNA-directed RNA polymerase specialized sigma24 family protein
MALPLNKHYPDGRRYFRPPPVEAAIDDLLAQDPAVVSVRAAIQDRGSPEFVQSESLVHLIRDARRRNDEATMNLLIPPLLQRCEANLRSKVSSDLPNAEDIRDEILAQFSELFAADGTGRNPDKLDFFEAHFNEAFKAFRVDIVRREETLRSRANVALPDEEEGESTLDKDFLKHFETAPAQESTYVLEQLKEAIRSLPPDEQKAVVLCHIMGYEVESKDPEKRTAATICQVSGRTIRNRLKRATAKLASFKERIQ